MVLRFGNLLEIALMLSALLGAMAGAPQGRSAIAAGFKVVLVQPQLDSFGAGVPVALMLGLGLSSLVMLGGVALLIGKVAETDVEQ